MKKTIYYVIWIALILLSILLANFVLGRIIDNEIVTKCLVALIGIWLILWRNKIFGFLDTIFKNDGDLKREEKLKQEELKEEKEEKQEEESMNYDE